MVLSVALLLRLPGLFTEFWLDEIWGWRLAQTLRSPLGVFTDIHYDTNHWLYTLILYALGPSDSWGVYRLPALLAGVATVALMLVIANDHDPVETAIAGVLGAGSQFLTVYASEARGYALVACLALLAYWAMTRWAARPSAAWSALFCGACVLGFLSHLTFLFAYAGFLLWSLQRLAAGRGPWRCRLQETLRLHLIPVLALAVLYVVDIRWVKHGGADDAVLVQVLGSVALLTTGLPTWPGLGLVALLGLFVFVLSAVWHMRQEGTDTWVFYAAVLILGPAAVLAVTAGGFSSWQERHFLVCVPFLLLLLARELARVWRVGAAGRLTCMFLQGLYLLGNGARLGRFYREGRGHYLEALQDMVAASREEIVTLASDHDFRNKTVLVFYAPYVRLAGRRLEYCDREHWPASGPEWFLVHSTADDFTPEGTIRIEGGHANYALVKSYPYGGLSGWHWYLYRRLDTPPTATENGPPAGPADRRP